VDCTEDDDVKSEVRRVTALAFSTTTARVSKAEPNSSPDSEFLDAPHCLVCGDGAKDGCRGAVAVCQVV
jgi:hypothetical protein